MSFTGGSIQQKTEISALDVRATTLESVKLDKTVFNAYDTATASKIALINATDTQQDSRLITVEADIDALEVRSTALEATRVTLVEYNAKVAEIATKDVEQDARLVATEKDIDALESRATGVESRASLLENSASALETGKVEVSVYTTKMTALDAKDASQDASIASLSTVKLDKSVYDAKMTLVDAKDAEHDASIASLTSSKVEVNTYNITIASIGTTNSEQDERLVTAEKDIDTLEARASALEPGKVDITYHNTTFAVINSENDTQDGRLTTAEADIDSLEARSSALENNTATTAAFNAALSEINTKNDQQDARISANENEIVALQARDISLETRATAVELRASNLESVKLDASVYDAKLALVNAKDAEQDGRILTAEADIDALEGRTTFIESSLATLASIKLDTSVFDAKLALVDAKDVEQDGRLVTAEADIVDFEVRATAVEGLTASLETNKVNVTTFNTKLATVDVKDLEQDGRLNVVEDRATTLETIKLIRRDFDEKIAFVDAKDLEQDGRLDRVEGKVSSLESDIGVKVQDEIDDKVSQVVFDSVKAQLENADSTLSASLATKVAATVQVQVDDVQNAIINSKVAQTAYDIKVAAIDAKDGQQDVRLTTLETGKMNIAGYLMNNTELADKDYFIEKKLFSIYEFIQAMLNTYCITKPDGNLYEFTANIQNLPTAPDYFTIINKDSKSINISLSKMLYKTMLGSVVLTDVNSNIIDSKNYKTIDSTTVNLSNSVNLISSQFPLTVSYRNSRNVIISSVSLSFADYNNLSNSSTNNLSNSPTINIGWANRLGGTASEAPVSLIVDSSNNIYILGRYNSNPFSIYNATGSKYGDLPNSGTETTSDIFIIKYASNGNVLWANKLGGTSTDIPVSLIVDSLNNIYISGSYIGNLSIYNADGQIFKELLNSSTTLSDIFTIKYDSNGSPLWANRLGGASTDTPVSLIVDSSNNIYISGSYSLAIKIYDVNGIQIGQLLNSGTNDIFIIKYASNGNRLWANRLGGASTETPVSLIVDSSNNIYISGRYNSAPLSIYNTNDTKFKDLINNGTNNPDIFIIKYDSNGSPLWANKLGGTSTDIPVSLIVDSSNNIYISGYYVLPIKIYNVNGVELGQLINSGSFDIFIVKYNSLGNVSMTARLAGASSETPFSLIIDSSNNFYISGTYNSNPISIYNANGNTKFKDLPNSGSTSTTDIFIVKYNSIGTPLWANRLGGTSNDTPVSLIVDSSNNIYISGTYNSNPFSIYNANGDKYGELLNSGTTSTTDIFTIKYDSNGDPLWANRLGGTSSDNPVSLIVDSSNNIYISGTYNSAPLSIYDATGSKYGELINSGITTTTDIFIIKYNSDGKFA